MKRLTMLLIAIAAVSLPVFFNPVLAAERTQYKCHLLLSDESEVVHYFVTDTATQTEFEEELTERVVYGADGVTSLAIAKAFQCVFAKQKFTSREARELEAKTPF